MVGLTNPVHIALIAVALLLVFGARRLPELGRSLGTGLREFKESVSAPAGRSALPSPGASDSAPEQGQVPAGGSPTGQ